LAALRLTAKESPGRAIALRRAVALRQAVALRDNRLRFSLGSSIANSQKVSGLGYSPKTSRSLDIAFSLKERVVAIALKTSS